MGLSLHTLHSLTHTHIQTYNHQHTQSRKKRERNREERGRGKNERKEGGERKEREKEGGGMREIEMYKRDTEEKEEKREKLGERKNHKERERERERERDVSARGLEAECCTAQFRLSDRLACTHHFAASLKSASSEKLNCSIRIISHWLLQTEMLWIYPCHYK